MFKCEYCGAQLASEDSLRKHIYRMHKALTIKCQCGHNVKEPQIADHVRVCQAHGLRRAHFWERFETVDPNGRIHNTSRIWRPFLFYEYKESI